MRVILAAALIPLALTGCIGVRTTEVPVAPPTQAVVVPQAAPPAVVVCSNGTAPPCL